MTDILYGYEWFPWEICFLMQENCKSFVHFWSPGHQLANGDAILENVDNTRT